MTAETDVTDRATAGTSLRRGVVNWTLALLTAPAAGLIVVLWFAAVMGTAGCTNAACQYRGPGEFLFGVLVYGAPVVAALTIGASFLTAKRRRGIVVPAVGWALLLTDVAICVFAFT